MIINFKLYNTYLISNINNFIIVLLYYNTIYVYNNFVITALRTPTDSIKFSKCLLKIIYYTAVAYAKYYSNKLCRTCLNCWRYQFEHLKMKICSVKKKNKRVYENNSWYSIMRIFNTVNYSLNTYLSFLSNKQ